MVWNSWHSRVATTQPEHFSPASESADISSDVVASGVRWVSLRKGRPVHMSNFCSRGLLALTPASLAGCTHLIHQPHFLTNVATQGFSLPPSSLSNSPWRLLHMPLPTMCSSPSGLFRWNHQKLTLADWGLRGNGMGWVAPRISRKTAIQTFED